MTLSNTRDSICRGELWLKQPRRGYRFNVDSVILAHLTEAAIDSSVRRAVDLGAGCGVIGLLLARRFPQLQMLLVECQSELAQLAEENIVDNELVGQVRLSRSDLRAHDNWSGCRPQLIISNPPFFPQGSGKPSADPQVAIAKHELRCNLRQLIQAVTAGAPPGGHLSIIYPASRGPELLTRLKESGWGKIVKREISTLPDKEPARIWIWVQLVGGNPEVLQRPTLVIEEEPGRYSAEMMAILRESPAKR